MTMRNIVGYSLIVSRGPRAGLTRTYKPAQRVRARRFADRLDMEYGAICASVHPIFEGSEVARSFTCSPASIVAEHMAELATCGVAP